MRLALALKMSNFEFLLRELTCSTVYFLEHCTKQQTFLPYSTSARESIQQLFAHLNYFYCSKAIQSFLIT